MRAVLALTLALLGAGCSTLPDPEAPEPDRLAWQERREALASVSTWTAVGRIFVQSEDQSWNATLRWRQDGDAYHIRLVGPLGQGSLQIAGDARGVVLRTSEQESFSAADPESLLHDALGWWVPVRGLRYWLTGIPDPGGEPGAPRLDRRGRLDSLRQSGWDIRYLRYQEESEPALPTKVFLDSGDLKVRIVVSRWELQA